MKKLILAAAALLLAVSANAQLGIVAGVTSSQTELDAAYKDIAETMNVDQYHAGLVYNLNLPLGLSIQPGIIYNMKGQSLASNIDALGKSEDVVINTKTGYLEVPVRAAWGIGLFNIVDAFVFAEPYLGYAINTETKTEFKDAAAAEILNGALGTELQSKNEWDARNRLEYGVGLGAGVKVLNRIALSVKYYWEFGNLYKEGENAPNISTDQMLKAFKDQKASGIAASLTIYF
ncbi:MAG: porin family protein [Candidatus Cryptobacteroides sp.]